LRCPYCDGDDTEVVETRDSEDLAAIRRRRQCVKCERRFTTYERAEKIELMVIKKDGQREVFDREKLRRGVLKAVEKRPISIELIDDLVNQVERELRRKDKVEISSKQIGNSILRKLKKIDKVAYLRFASVYLDFEDLGDFEEAIEKVN